MRQYFSLYRAVSQREGERAERIDESKNVLSSPTRTYCKRNRPLPYCNQHSPALEVYPAPSHHPTTPPKRGRKRREWIDENKNVQTNTTRTYCKRSRSLGAVGPCPTVIQIVGRPGTGGLPSTIAPPDHPCSWLVGYFGLNGPLRQYFSLYRAVSQREGERKEK